jgi:hypothetical protein
MTSLHEQILTQVELAALRVRDHHKSALEAASAFNTFAEHVHGFAADMHEQSREKSDETRQLLEARPKTHGDFAPGAKFVQTVMRAAQESPSWGQMTDVQKECFHHIAQKLQRVVCGDPDFADHWDDVAGYAKIAVREINRG